MRNEIFYFNTARMDRNLINLCSSISTIKDGIKLKYYLLPDRQMSFLKILDLPLAPKNKLRDMVRFQMIKIYPGNTEDISFDFIPFKTATGWKIVLYILKKKYLNEVSDNEGFEGLILPLQLLPGRDLKNLSNLIISYPDMVELWKLTDGVPYGVERHDPKDFLVKNLLLNENKDITSDKILTICSDNETLKWEMKNVRTNKFSETLNSLSKKVVFFPEYRVTKRDRITIPIVLTAFIISLFLLSLTVLKHEDFMIRERDVNTWIKSVRLETEQNREALGIITKLENELKDIGKDVPVNVYNLLIRTRNAINTKTVVLSFGLKGEEFTLTLNSKSALSDLEGIKDEFGNVRASSIRTLDDGNESYTVWVEIGPWR